MVAPLHPKVAEVTERIRARSTDTRRAYLELIASRRPDAFARKRLTEGNQAHAAAACAVMDKTQVLGNGWPNIGIITAYNDMLSAHQPYGTYPDLLKAAAREVNATAQVAGGVPAMCDGVTQGQQGMELSLFSRDVIALAAAVGLSHDTFDGAVYLGICDKIVPGLVMAALRFGWLPTAFIPAGPMPSGLPNPEKARIRQQFAAGEVGRDVLLKAEAESYHAPGTCTFYGTANSNQMLMEVMGLHLPGAAFINPGASMRKALSGAAIQRVAALHAQGDQYVPMGEMIDERSFVNAIVGLMATGGSTNLALHIPAMAACAGISITLEDFSDLSAVTPLMCRIYPNGTADVNHFHAAGGMGFLIGSLLKEGLMHADAQTLVGTLADCASEPFMDGETLTWRPAPAESGNTDILRPASDPFSPEGGLRLLDGPLGRGVIKISAVKPEHHVIEAPARVFESQEALKAAFQDGELDRDFVAVVRFQGPSANGMPELHGLSPSLGVLQDRGHNVALVTDGRMSGASGKVPAAIHVGPEAAKGGPLARVQDGDVIRLDATAGRLDIQVSEAEFAARTPAQISAAPTLGLGRELFDAFRAGASDSESGASLFNLLGGSA